MPAGARHTDRGEAQKQKLVDAAYALVAELGLEGLRTRAVCRRAGLNVSTLHYYFATKEELIRSVAQKVLADFKSPADLGGDAADAVDAMERLRRELSAQSRQARTNAVASVVLMEIFTRAARDRRLTPVARQLLSRWEKRLGLVVRAGACDGLFEAGPEPGATARALQCLFLGRALVLLIQREEVPADSLARVLARWLAPRQAERGAAPGPALPPASVPAPAADSQSIT